jgi:hypothetical protein
MNKVKLYLLYFLSFIQIISVAIAFFGIVGGQLVETIDFFTNNGLVSLFASIFLISFILEMAIPQLNKKYLDLFDKFDKSD